MQLGYLGADVGLPELAHRARLRAIHAIRGRNDAETRSVRAQLEREAGEKIEARPLNISPPALAELRRALDGETPAAVATTSIELAHELVPGLASVVLKRRPTTADVPARESVFGALGRASSPPRSTDQLVLDLRSGTRETYAEPAPASVRAGPKIGRNDPCLCGSGRKWKKCCGASTSR